MRRKARDDMLAMFAAADELEREAATVERKSDRPLQIATFEC